MVCPPGGCLFCISSGITLESKQRGPWWGETDARQREHYSLMSSLRDRRTDSPKLPQETLSVGALTLMQHSNARVSLTGSCWGFTAREGGEAGLVKFKWARHPAKDWNANVFLSVSWCPSIWWKKRACERNPARIHTTAHLTNHCRREETKHVWK